MPIIGYDTLMEEVEKLDPEAYRGRLITDIFYITEGDDKLPRKQFYAKTQERLLIAEQQVMEEGESGLLHIFATKIRSGASIKRLVREHGLSEDTVTRVLEIAGIPHLDHAAAVANVWADPDYRERQARSASKTLSALWQDPEYRDRRTEESGQRMTRQWQDPDFRQHNVERGRVTMARLKQDPDFQEKNAAACRELFRSWWQNPIFRANHAEVGRQTLSRLRQNPEFVAKQSAASSENLKRLKQDPEFQAKDLAALQEMWRNTGFRRRIKEAAMKARFDPENVGRYFLPSISGFRPDIGFEALSAWEANVGRVLILLNREFYTLQELRLAVTPEYQYLFNDTETLLHIDFVTLNRNGAMVLYEIMAHPLENPSGWAKLNMAIYQYPGINIRIITEHFYNRLRSRFENRINRDPRFKGWEAEGFNLRTHPQIFG